jgi:hypothetical protein
MRSLIIEGAKARSGRPHQAAREARFVRAPTVVIKRSRPHMEVMAVRRRTLRTAPGPHSIEDRAKRRGSADAAFIGTDDIASVSPAARSAIEHRARRIHPGGPKLTGKNKTVVVFLQAFELAGFDEILPAGEYEIETDLPARVDSTEPDNLMPNVFVHLHPRASHPGLSRGLTVPLAALDRAMIEDGFTGKSLRDCFLEEMLVDPMIRVVMQADGVSDDDIRGFYSGRARKAADDDEAMPRPTACGKVAGREGMSPRPGSPRPGIGE